MQLIWGDGACRYVAFRMLAIKTQTLVISPVSIILSHSCFIGKWAWLYCWQLVCCGLKITPNCTSVCWIMHSQIIHYFLKLYSVKEQNIFYYIDFFLREKQMCDRGCGKVLKGSKLGKVFSSRHAPVLQNSLRAAAPLKVALIPTRQIAATITHLERSIQQN